MFPLLPSQNCGLGCRPSDNPSMYAASPYTTRHRRYGKLNEIWFDGGISQRISTRIVALLKKLQPDAVTYGAGIENDMNEVDWVGTETGEAKYPIWSTGCNSPGGGSTGVSPLQNPTNFCPKGSDCTLQSPDVWFWVPDTPSKSTLARGAPIFEVEYHR